MERSAAMLLAWLGERRGSGALVRASVAIEQAVDEALADPNSRTADLGGPLGTQAFVIARAVECLG